MINWKEAEDWYWNTAYILYYNGEFAPDDFNRTDIYTLKLGGQL